MSVGAAPSQLSLMPVREQLLAQRAAPRVSLEMHPLGQLQVQRGGTKEFVFMDGPVSTSESWKCPEFNIMTGSVVWSWPYIGG